MSKSKKTEHDQDDVEYMVDLLMDTSMSLTDIAKELNWTIHFLNKKINQMGLSWVKDKRRKMSRGQAALTAIMQKLLPNEKIINEYHLGDRLKLDIYCPKYKLGAEYHGRQHFYYTGRFFDSKDDFDEAVKRDQKKIELCKQQGIALLVFRYNDKLTEEAVFIRMLEAIRSFDSSETKNINRTSKSITTNPYYQEAKKRHSESKKRRYREIKNKNDNRRKSK